MATILDVNVNSDLCPQDSTNTFYSDTKNVESSESDYESVESDDSICISNDSDYNCDRSQTDQQKVTIAPVTTVNFTTEEKELRGHLNSLYLQLLKKHYDKPFLPDGSSFHPVNDPIYGVQNTSISGNLLYLYDCIIRKRVELIIDTGKRRALSFEDKLLLTHEIKKAPEHLISQDEKDLLIKLINNRMDSTQIEKSSAVLKKYIYHFIVHYLNEKLVAFSEDNDGLKDCNEFEFFDRLITKQEHLEIQKKINQLALINMEKNLLIYFKDKYEKHFSDFKHADLHEHVKNRLNEMYSVDLEQETNTDGQSMHNRITSKIPTYKKPQIDTHSVINTSVTPIDYSPEEQELRAKLDSVYHLVFKKFYDKGLIKNPSHFPPNFDDPLCDIRGLFVSELILKGSEEYIECSVVCVLYNIAKNLLNAEDKKRYVDELKNTPEHLIDQEEKDLIIKNYAECLLKSEPQLYRAEIEKLFHKIKAHVEDITINYLSERILGFSRDFNLKNGKEFEFFNNLITQKENFNVEDTIYYTILEIMEKKVLGSDEDIKILR